MIKCPMCDKNVIELKKNCHVLPRAWVKMTKKQKGRNILLDFKNSTIAVNQTDYMDDFWCETCESISAIDDGYGTNVLLKKNVGSISKITGKKINFVSISSIDYVKFKKFILSIAIRDHLARTIRKETIITESEFILLKENYNNFEDKIKIYGHFIEDTEPLSHVLHRPVAASNKNGVNFQLFNFCFLIGFKNEVQFEPLSLKTEGSILLPIINPNQSGNLKEFDKEYEKIVTNPVNEKQISKINKKYP